LVEHNTEKREAFEIFLEGLQENINPSITKIQAIEMLAQHIITQPIFEALFEGYSFEKNNAVSTAMKNILAELEKESLAEDSDALQKFYDSVRRRVEGVDNSEGKQKIIVELYDKFFKTAFPKLSDQLGIVYTPVEVVDFIIHSVDDVLKQEFGRSISDENVHVLDPFTGTGTFITRLLQSGLINEKDLSRKYQSELHANEIVLLAYYIAAVNIENAYHDLVGHKKEYESFDGIVLTDTFQMTEDIDIKDGKRFKQHDAREKFFPINSDRITKQKNAPVRVIMGNPPYSVGQKSENDNAKNQEYKKLDSRIAKTYVTESNSTMNKALYDSYIKAFRWSADRLDPENGGVIAFVSNGSWLDGNSTDGFRKAIEKEFSSIWVFNLRGNQRTSGELSRKEGGKIFGSGSRTPISITLLVKNPDKKTDKATIHYHDIGDYLSREEKLAIVKKFKSVGNNQMNWKTLQPNEHGDWLNQRNDLFETFIEIGSKKKIKEQFFNINSNGVITSRDAWAYNFSKDNLGVNMKNTIQFYNKQLDEFKSIYEKDIKTKAADVINNDPREISWSRGLKQALEGVKERRFKEEAIRTGAYRPFMKQYFYFDRDFNECVYQQPAYKPKEKLENIIISVSGVGASKGFSTFISDEIPNYHFLDTMNCFPLFYYEEREKNSPSLFDAAGETVSTSAEMVFQTSSSIELVKVYGKNELQRRYFLLCLWHFTQS
jgi:predicted helicase